MQYIFMHSDDRLDKLKVVKYNTIKILINSVDLISFYASKVIHVEKKENSQVLPHSSKIRIISLILMLI